MTATLYSRVIELRVLQRFIMKVTTRTRTLTTTSNKSKERARQQFAKKIVNLWKMLPSDLLDNGPEVGAALLISRP